MVDMHSELWIMLVAARYAGEENQFGDGKRRGLLRELLDVVSLGMT